ncbi:hypothetical protein [Nocardia cerradoensis]|uniref:Uncharacterized protein n=1 Tax=Nocardia cerradoensis TaxID=85688 RepID=A0A231GTM0_9NOCA|nr:hypothetical protein [Nocardia cerradoensis]NKY48028.1 hypothetical protein [Nocardia cerradoensis]OXR39895.1 hypothetical protein B7C42_08041 [Nocardia cerradoensis]
MTDKPTVAEVAAGLALEKIRDQIEPRITAAVTETREAAQRQITEWLQSGAPAAVSGAVDGKADARDRAQRTAIQGAISTVVVAILLAVAGVIGGAGFDFTDAGDWKAVGGAAIGAVVTVVTAYLHRLVKPPADG